MQCMQWSMHTAIHTCNHACRSPHTRPYTPCTQICTQACIGLFGWRCTWIMFVTFCKITASTGSSTTPINSFSLPFLAICCDVGASNYVETSALTSEVLEAFEVAALASMKHVSKYNTTSSHSSVNSGSHSELKFRKKSIFAGQKTHFFYIFKSKKFTFFDIFKSTKTHFLLFQKW